jgi:UTP--glucose-1-phosphate uridylyltransferase
MTDGLSSSVEKMRAEGLGDAAVDTFRHYYERLRAASRASWPRPTSSPSSELPDFADLPDSDAGEALDQAVVLKLNGGLGTGMGMTKAKSLLEVKDGLTFLDVIARPGPRPARAHGARLPLVLMNSFATREDSLALLERYPGLSADAPADFVQNKVPKLLADELTPVSWPDNPGQEWAPPGHGDLYTALVTSGVLDELLERGYRYAFVSNSDNLGAVLEPRRSPGSPARTSRSSWRPSTARGRQEGRAHRPAARRRRPRAARGGPDARRGPRRLPGHRAPPVLQREQRLAEPARPCAPSSTATTGCSRCR